MEGKFQEILSTIANWERAGTREEDVRQSIAFRRAFSEWHFSSRQFAGGQKLQAVLQKVWRLSSAKKKSDAEYHLRNISLRYLNYLRMFREDSDGLDRDHKEQAMKIMVTTLNWLQNRLGRLKVCENPECATGRTYFFRAFTNDKYCCIKCGEKPKALRQAKRDAELGKSPKEYKKSAEQRRKMSISATERWARRRAKPGKLKRGDNRQV